MPRYASEHKDLTRQRIIEAAGRRLRSSGIDGSGVASLMADAGLTNGAFYRHFSSKEELVVDVIEEHLREQAEGYELAATRGETMWDLIDSYLSATHRDDVEGGCTSAALLDEIARASESVKTAYGSGVVRLSAALRQLCRLPEETSDAAILGILATMVGTLQLARAMSDSEASDGVLEQGKKNAGLLLEAAATTTHP